MFCCTLLYVHSSIAIILMGKREQVALLNLSSWCLVIVEWLFLAVPWGCLRFVIVVFPDHTRLLFLVFTYLNLSLLNRVCRDSLLIPLTQTGNIYQKIIIMLPVFIAKYYFKQSVQSTNMIKNF